MEGILGFAFERYEKGIIFEKNTDGLQLEQGNKDAVLKMSDKIVFRESFGSVLAEGLSEFRKAIADWYKDRFSVVDLNPYEEVLVLIGSKEGVGHI